MSGNTQMGGQIMEIWLAYALGGTVAVVIGLWANVFLKS